MKSLAQISYARSIPVVTLRHRVRRLGLNPKIIDGTQYLTPAQERQVVVTRKKGRPKKSSKD
jgi:hypothetical protein